MNIKQINEVISKLSKELTKLNKKNKSDITIFYEDNGSFNHVVFHSTDMVGDETCKYFELYYKPSFYVNLSEEDNLSYDIIVDRIKEYDSTMTDEDIENYFNNNYDVKEWTFETRIANDMDYDEDFNTIISDNIDDVVREIMNDIKIYLEL